MMDLQVFRQILHSNNSIYLVSINEVAKFTEIKIIEKLTMDTIFFLPFCLSPDGDA
jgi:hypothetical protein